ncbi:MAG: DUF721 domain-containing protein [Rickettsia sp.]|nr:DUF721 domain-containing protein [Rickettsia sp.]
MDYKVKKMHSVSHSLRNSFKNIIFKRYPLLSEIIFNWNDILGETLSLQIYPKRICVNNKKSILHLGILQNHLGTEIYYQKHLILERITRYFGSNIIDDIKIG